MAVSVVLPHALVPFARGSGTVVVRDRCGTVGEALAGVATQWPAVTDRILTEQGDLRRHVNLFVGDQNVRFLQGLETRLEGGETITVVAAVSGG